MIRIGAVDDERHALKRFERMVKQNDEVQLCGLFETGAQLLSYLQESPLDAVFLDIEMPGVNGMEIAQQILDLNGNINIVFITAFNQYAVDAFEMQAMDYILKPIKKERLEKTIERLLNMKRPSIKPGKVFIQCFGDFEVFIDEEALVWKNSKAKEILAFLVHKNGVAVSWEKIADAVWPDYDLEKSQTNFHANSYLLRKKLAAEGIEGILEGGRGNYRVRKEKVICDYFQLDAMIKDKLINRKEDYKFIEDFLQKGYLEESGYSWAQPRAAELDKICKELVEILI